ncbi:hypothetical protein LTR36_000857 [Oleoguttula mirabilis]|uniref:hydroxymethylglutaryl-CoA lyase n=1 Tax=Oleoguttula mirabilis TaxID=1507867 RepID=A0AAV9J3I3_9PEZI|nr:hypothetical protein LTR36_000857 [Oleoguttula mirabilis]
MPARKDFVRIVEVGSRDGLQNVKTTIPTAVKLALIRRLRDAGLQTIEVTSVVSPRAVPQLADCRDVLADAEIQALLRDTQLRMPVLIPNLKGLGIAVEHGVREVAVFVSATEGFSKANIGCTVEQGLDRARQVATRAREQGLAVRGYVSCVFACPFDGPTPPAAVLACVQQLLDMGCYEISLGDTVGVGVPADVKALVSHLLRAGIPVEQLAGHFHDTYGQAVANVWAAYDCGMRVFDSSVGGLGGCPYAPGAKGNLATEDLVYTLHQAGVQTGTDLPMLVDIGVWISRTLAQPNSSRAGSALATAMSSSTKKPPPTKAPGASPEASRMSPWLHQASVEGLEVQRSGTNIKITLNRPKNGNALTAPMISAITSLFETAASDPSITRIAIAARGKFFCTGMDLAKGSSPVAKGGAAGDEQYARLTRLFEAIDAAPQVTIACVQGPAFGGGVGLAFACDVRLMAAAASMTLSETRLGLAPATISKYVVREWGVAFAREAMLSARAVPAMELKRLGKVGEVVATPEALSAALDAYLAHLRHAAPRASAMAKQLVRLSWLDGGGGAKQADGIRKVFDEMMAAGSESAHGLKSFQAGNKPVDWDEFTLARAARKAKL